MTDPKDPPDNWTSWDDPLVLDLDPASLDPSDADWVAWCHETQSSPPDPNAN